MGGSAASDLALTAAAAQGQQEARRQLVVRLLPRVRSTVRYLASRSPDVDDMTQRALVELLGAAGSFRGESSLDTWADRVTTRVVYRLLHKRRLQSEREEGVDEAPEFPDWSREPSDPGERLHLRKALAALLARLPEERRVALVLKHVHGYSVEEIAEQTRAPVNTVRDRLRVARAELRRWMDESEERHEA